MNNHPDNTAASAEGKTRIAIMGATSHIAKGLINNFIRDPEARLFLFARKTEPLYTFLNEIGARESSDLTICEGYQDFLKGDYDIIINCIGLGTVSQEPHIYKSFFMVTEEFDNLVISYLTESPSTLFINFSSGAVYGRDFSEPAGLKTLNKICINSVTKHDSFTIAKVNSEAKHRVFENLSIIDIRVFSYFSRFIDIRGKYFITELFHSLINDRVFHTNEINIVRDYIHPDDLFALVKKCIALEGINTSFDAYSVKPAEKTEILEFFASRYNLKYKVEKTTGYDNVTGRKDIYYSLYKKAEEIGYQPMYSSMATLSREAEYLLQGKV
jgi:nucleoside-diphosphate-sugar epimerase